MARIYVDLLTSLHRSGMDAGACRPTMASLGGGIARPPTGCSINAPPAAALVVGDRGEGPQHRGF